MTRADKLRALAKRVEAGSDYIDLNDWAGVFPPASAYGTESFHQAHKAHDFYGGGGSLDACAALHKAVLGERWAVLSVCQLPEDYEDDFKPTWFWSSRLIRVGSVFSVKGVAPTEARSRLAAILRALAEEEGMSDG